MENFFVTIGLGWTMSKILPYIVLLTLGVGVYRLFRKKFRKKWMRITVLLLMILAPTGIYFAINPIYEGDFSNNYARKQAIDSEWIADGKLTVIAIPGCPFCLASIARMKQVKERVGGDVDIEFRVLTKKEANLKSYENESGGSVTVVMDTNEIRLSQLAGGRFPTFVFREGADVYVWSNDGFGVRALDWVESRM